MDAVAEHDWEIGTVLVSERWKDPRTIEDIKAPEIKLRTPRSYAWVTTVPNDARELGVEEAPAESVAP